MMRTEIAQQLQHEMNKYGNIVGRSRDQLELNEVIDVCNSDYPDESAQMVIVGVTTREEYLRRSIEYESPDRSKPDDHFYLAIAE